MLNDSQMLKAFIKRGRSEVRYSVGSKPKHFEFLNDLNEEYPEIFKKILEKINSNFNKDKLWQLINNIDVNLPLKLRKFRLSKNRKLLMHKLIILRIEKLFELI